MQYFHQYNPKVCVGFHYISSLKHQLLVFGEAIL